MSLVCPISLDVSDFTQPFEMALIRRHCNVEDDEDPVRDDLLGVYARAAVLWAEGETHRTIIARTHQWTLREFPYGCEDVSIRLPRGKTQSVTSVVYSSGNVLTTLTGPSASPPGTGFQENLLGNDGGILTPPYGGSWPVTDYGVPAPVTITFSAGWTPSTIPDDLRYALLFYISDAYELRGTSDLDSAGKNLMARNSLISSYVLHRW